MRTLAIVAAAATLVGLSSASGAAQAANLLGQTFDYCTNSVYGGAVTTDASACDSGVVFTGGSATVGDPAVEVILDQGGVRRVDLSDLFIDVIYNEAQSASADLFVLTGFTNIAGLTLVGDNPLNLTWTFTADSIGLLVNSPLSNGTTRLQVATRPTTGVVPEPGAWALMILGFGATGSMMRRKRIASPAAA